ncbi:hypothetical protein NKJ46_28340 [Mesorhizobium sp. M0166]|uniref:hypothetical protein n=1 Tax=Mesorhizobium sp. M0166 TaxID=2956902 RepID=UPI00333DA359
MPMPEDLDARQAPFFLQLPNDPQQSLPMRKEHPMSFTPLIAPEIKARFSSDQHCGAER